MLNSSTDVPYASGPSTRYHSAVSLTNLEPSCDQLARHSIPCGFKGNLRCEKLKWSSDRQQRVFRRTGLYWLAISPGPEWYLGRPRHSNSPAGSAISTI